MTRCLVACAVTTVLGMPATARAQQGSPTGPPQAAPVASPRQDPGGHPGVDDLIRALRYDFTAAVSAPNLAILGLGGTGAFGAHGIDRHAATTSWGNDAFFKPGKEAGSALVQGAAAFGT
jgi:hypothetical protein